MKFEILNPLEIAHFLRQFTVTADTAVTDIYLDTDNGDMFKRGIFIRIRDGCKLDFKFNMEDIAKSLNDSIDHFHCDEASFPVPLAQRSLAALNTTLSTLSLRTISTPSLDVFKKANNFIESMVIEKRRKSYDTGNFKIDIDHVAGLGEYLEIEKMTDERADTEQIFQEMQQFLHGLQLKYIDTGYNELYWRKHNFSLYLQGKYLLPEDRQTYRPQSIKT